MKEISKSEWEALPKGSSLNSPRKYLRSCGTEICFFVQTLKNDELHIVTNAADLDAYEAVRHSVAISSLSDVPLKFEHSGEAIEKSCEFLTEPIDHPNFFFQKSDTRLIPPSEDGFFRARSDIPVCPESVGKGNKIHIDGSISIMQMLGKNLSELISKGEIPYEIVVPEV